VRSGASTLVTSGAPQSNHARLTAAAGARLGLNVILVLKGDRTIVANPSGEAWVNPTGNPGMATGGTGDILTGMVAGMLAQHPERACDAVIAAVHLHGLAGDVASYGVSGAGEQCLVATDLIKALPRAFGNTRLQADHEWVGFGQLGSRYRQRPKSE